MSYQSVEEERSRGRIAAAQIEAGSRLGVAQIGADADTSKAGIQADASKYGAESYAQALNYGARTRLAGEQYGADRRLEGIKYENPLVQLPLSALTDFDLGSRAEGGPVTKGKPYIVGEQGPEVVVPEHNGTVVPNQSAPIQVIKGMNVSSVGGEQPAPPLRAEGQPNQRGATIMVPLRVYEGIMRARAEMMRAQGEGGMAGLNRDVLRQKQNLDAFTNRIQSDPRFYKEAPEGLVPVSPGLGQIVLGYKALAATDPESAFKSFETKAARHLDESKYINEQGISAALDNLTKAGYTLTPGQKAWLATQQNDPAAETKRRDTILQWVKPTAIPQAAQPEPTVAQAPPSQPEPLAQPPALSRQGIDMQSLQNNQSAPQGNVLPPISVPAMAFRPDQVGQLNQNFRNQITQRNKLSTLSRNLEQERLGIGR